MNKHLTIAIISILLLSGLAVKREDINYAIKKVRLNPEKPTNWSDDDLLKFIRQLRGISKPMVIAANKIDIDIAKDNTKLLDESGYPTVSCCAEAELALRRASQMELIKYLPGNEFFTFVDEKKINVKQKEALESIKKRILDKWGSTGVQQTINKAFLDLLKMIVVYPVLNVDKLTDHDGNILLEAYLVPIGTTDKEFATIIQTE